MKKFFCIILSVMIAGSLLGKELVVGVSDQLELREVEGVKFDPVGSYRAIKGVKEGSMDCAIVLGLKPLREMLLDKELVVEVIGRKDLYVGVAKGCPLNEVSVEDLRQVFGKDSVFAWKRLNREYDFGSDYSGIVLPGVDFEGFEVGSEVFRSAVIAGQQYNSFVEHKDVLVKIRRGEPYLGVFVKEPGEGVKVLRVTQGGEVYELGCDVLRVSKRGGNVDLGGIGDFFKKS